MYRLPSRRITTSCCRWLSLNRLGLRLILNQTDVELTITVSREIALGEGGQVRHGSSSSLQEGNTIEQARRRINWSMKAAALVMVFATELGQ